MNNTPIEWSDFTWNPVTGCTKVSQGCKHCYAERLWPKVEGARVKREGGDPRPFTDVWTHKSRLDQPLRMRKPHRIFVNSMSDLFHDDVDDIFLREVFAVMALAPQHTFQVLTKRASRMRDYVGAGGRAAEIFDYVRNGELGYWAGADKLPPLSWPLPNVWLGVSVEDQDMADQRISRLLKTPAAVRFLSCEPLLGPITFRPYTLTERPCFVCQIEDETGGARGSMSHPINCGWRHDTNPEPRRSGIDWVIAGGESGPGARPSHPDWHRSLRDQCAAAGVPFLFKQWGEWAPPEVVAVPHWKPAHTYVNDPARVPAYMMRVGKKAAGRTLDSRTHDEYPA